MSFCSVLIRYILSADCFDPDVFDNCMNASDPKMMDMYYWNGACVNATAANKTSEWTMEAQKYMDAIINETGISPSQQYK